MEKSKSLLSVLMDSVITCSSQPEVEPIKQIRIISVACENDEPFPSEAVLGGRLSGSTGQRFSSFVCVNIPDYENDGLFVAKFKYVKKLNHEVTPSYLDDITYDVAELLNLCLGKYQMRIPNPQRYIAVVIESKTITTYLALNDTGLQHVQYLKAYAKKNFKKLLKL